MAFRTVRNSTSDDFLMGDAREAWVRLREEFESSTGSAQIELKRKFHGANTRANQNPVSFVTNLENIRERLERLGVIISDNELMLQILDSLPQEYENTQDLMKLTFDTVSYTHLTLPTIA